MFFFSRMICEACRFEKVEERENQASLVLTKNRHGLLGSLLPVWYEKQTFPFGDFDISRVKEWSQANFLRFLKTKRWQSHHF
jgi:hypothetical protein